MLKFILLIAIGFIICSCLDIENRAEIKTLRQLINKSDTALCKKGFKRLKYGGKWNPTIQIISMGYTTQQYRFKTVDEVRDFFIPLFEEYIRPFNNEKSIRPFLSNYPLDATNLELSITFMDSEKEDLFAPWICRVSTHNGKIVYQIQKPELTHCSTLYSETFEEAKKKTPATTLTNE